MANVETEQKASFASSQSTDGSASVAVIEENLAALLKAVSAPAEIVAPAKHPSPVAPVNVEPAHPTPEPAIPSSEPALAIEPASTRAADASTVSKESVAAEAPVQEQPPPVVESQQEVVSKLALLSSIKQRRAVSALNTAPRADSGVAPAVQSALPTESAWPTESASPMESASLMGSASPAGPAAQAVARAKEHPVPEQREQQTETAKNPLPAEKNRQTDAQTESHSASAVLPTSSYSAQSSSTLFAAASAGTAPASSIDESLTGKSKNFVASGAGMTIIAGSLVGVCLIGYLLIGHGAKPPVGSAKATSTEPRVATSAPAPVPAVVKTALPVPNALPASAGIAAIPSSTGKKDDKNPLKIDPAQTAKPAPPSPASSTPAATSAAQPTTDGNAPPAARAFTPPAAGARPPADTTIREAPPTLSAATPAVPSITVLPAGIAPPPVAAPPPAAAKASGPREIAVPGKVQASKLARSVTPSYPSLAKTARVQGTVRFRVTIATDGQVKGLMLLGGPAPLAQAAADAVRQWRYQPTIVNGEAVEVITEVEVNFQLN